MASSYNHLSRWKDVLILSLLYSSFEKPGSYYPVLPDIRYGICVQISRHVNSKDMSQIQHFHDFIFENLQVSCSPIHASQSSPIKFWGWKFCGWPVDCETSKLHPLKNCMYTVYHTVHKCRHYIRSKTNDFYSNIKKRSLQHRGFPGGHPPKY